MSEIVKSARLKEFGNQPIVSKGCIDGISITVWDVCDECIDGDCVISGRCPYTKRDGKCQVQAKYLDKVLFQILENNKDFMSDGLMTRFGFELLPLFGHLIKFKIEEMGMRRRVYIDEKGFPRINPVYREIRETIRAIGGAYKSIVEGVKREGSVSGKGMGDEEWIEGLLVSSVPGVDNEESPMKLLEGKKKRSLKKKGKK